MGAGAPVEAVGGAGRVWAWQPTARPGQRVGEVFEAHCTAHVCTSQLGQWGGHHPRQLGSPTVLAADANLNTAMTTASTFVGESIPVVDRGKLVGALSEGDIFNKVLQIQASLRQQ